MIVIGVAVIIIGLILSTSSAFFGTLFGAAADNGIIIIVSWLFSIVFLIGGILWGAVLIAQGIG